MKEVLVIEEVALPMYNEVFEECELKQYTVKSSNIEDYKEVLDKLAKDTIVHLTFEVLPVNEVIEYARDRFAMVEVTII